MGNNSGKTDPRGIPRPKPDGRVRPLPDSEFLPPTAPYARISKPPPLPKDARKRTPFPPIRDGTERPVPVPGVSRKTPPPLPLSWKMVANAGADDEVTPPFGTRIDTNDSPKWEGRALCVSPRSPSGEPPTHADIPRTGFANPAGRREVIWQDVAKYAPPEERRPVAALPGGGKYLPPQGFNPAAIPVNPSPIAKRLSSLRYSFLCLPPIKQLVISALFVLAVLGSAAGIFVQSCLQDKKGEKIEQAAPQKEVAPQKEIKKEPVKVESKAEKSKPASFYIPKVLRNPPMKPPLPNRIPQRVARNSLRS